MRSPSAWPLETAMRPARLERATFWFVAKRSIQLSYGRVLRRRILPSARGAVNGVFPLCYTAQSEHLATNQKVIWCERESEKRASGQAARAARLGRHTRQSAVANPGRAGFF